MIRTLIPVVIAVLSLGRPPLAVSQNAETPSSKSKNRTLQYAEPGRKAAIGVEVVTPPPKGDPLKVWELGEEGPSHGKDANYVVGIDSIALYPRTMRVTYYLQSKGEATHGTQIIGAKLYVVDSGGETYHPTNMQIKPNREGHFKVLVQGGAKERFWVEYPAPKNPTSTLKFGIPVYDFLWSGIAFPPFSVALNKPLFYDNGVFEIDEDNKADKGADEDGDGGKPATGPRPKGGRGAVTTSRISPGSSPREIEEIQEKFRALSEEGRWIAGNLSIGGQANVGVKLIFKKRARSEFVEATLHWLDGTPRSVELHGAYFENSRFTSGLALVLRDRSNPKVEYTFRLEGNNLSGNDGLGNTLSFNIPARK